MHSNTGIASETGSFCNTTSLDSWKTSGGNGDSGYTNKTSTTLPLNGNSVNSIETDSQNGAFRNESGLPLRDKSKHKTTENVTGYMIPRPPSVHPQIDDVINSHHVLSPAARNNICR